MFLLNSIVPWEYIGGGGGQIDVSGDNFGLEQPYLSKAYMYVPKWARYLIESVLYQNALMTIGSMMNGSMLELISTSPLIFIVYWTQVSSLPCGKNPRLVYNFEIIPDVMFGRFEWCDPGSWRYFSVHDADVIVDDYADVDVVDD